MTQITPTVNDINNNLIAQLQAQLNQSVPLLPRSFLRVLAKSIAGVYVLAYKYSGFVALQQFVATATDQPTEINGTSISPLIEWGRLIGVGDPTAATRAELNITVTGNGFGTIPIGTQLLGRSNNVVYLTTTASSVSVGMQTITVRASSDQQGGNGSGTVGNLPAGSVVSFPEPLAFIETDASVESAALTGANREPVEQYRRRVIRRFQRRPQGGALIDYQIWSEGVAGIVNAYPYTGDPGNVTVYIEANDQPNGIPTGAQITAATNAINTDPDGQASRRPVNARVTVLAITREPFAVAITGLIVDNQPTVRTQIEAALLQYFNDREPFITGVSVQPRRDRITRSAVAGVVETIVTANSGVFTSISITRSGGTTVTSYTLTQGQKASRGAVTYV